MLCQSLGVLLLLLLHMPTDVSDLARIPPGKGELQPYLDEVAGCFPFAPALLAAAAVERCKPAS